LRLRELKPDTNGMVRIISAKKCAAKFDMLIPFDKAVIHVKEGSACIKDENTVVKLRTYKQLKKTILKRDNHTCHYCGQFGNTVDHKKPRSKGGCSTPANLVCCCRKCNMDKSNMEYIEFMNLIGR
jgi:hypothetical protein